MKIEIPVGVKIKGEYRLQVFGQGQSPDEGGVARIDTGFFDNILTDAVMDYYAGNSGGAQSQFAYCGVGTRTSTPVGSDTSIDQIGGRAVRYSLSQTNSGYVNTATAVYRFAASAVVGTISNVGIFSAASAGSLASRALIKDLGGTPTSITLITGDTLYVTYRVSLTVSSSDATGTFLIDEAGVSTSYNYAVRPSSFSNLLPDTDNNGSYNALVPLANTSAVKFRQCYAYSTQVLGAYTSVPAGTGFASALAVYAAYVSGSFVMSCSYVFSVSQGNTGSGIGSLAFTSASASSAGFQMLIAKTAGGGNLMKDATKTFSITMNYTFSR